MMKFIKLNLIVIIAIFAINQDTFSRTREKFKSQKDREEELAKRLLEGFPTLLKHVEKGVPKKQCGESDLKIKINSEHYCNPIIQTQYKNILGRTIYSLLQNENPYESCTNGKKDIITDDQSEKLTEYLNRENSSLQGYNSFAFECEMSLLNYLGDRDPLTFLAMLKASHTLQHRKIESIAIRSLKGLNEIDNVLGRKNGTKSVLCSSKISPQVHERCTKLKSCKKRKGKGFLYSTMTYNVLKTTIKLDKMITELRKKRLQYGRKRAHPNDPRKKIWKKEITKLDGIIQDLEDNRTDILQTIPWIHGSHFKNKLSELKKRIGKIQTSADENPIQKMSITQDIGTHLIKQLSEDKKELLKRYDQAHKAFECLQKKGSCDDFEEIIQLAPPLPLPEEKENNPESIAIKLLKQNQCIEKKYLSVTKYRQSALDVATISSGFLLGGLGGLTRMAAVAGRILTRGQRLKALGATALIGGEAIVIGNSGKDALKSCSKTETSLTNFNGSNQLSCESENEMHLLNNHSQCLKDLALFSITLLAVGAPEIASRFRKVKLPSLKQSPDKIAEELIQTANLKNIPQKDLKNILLNLALRGGEVKNFKAVLKGLEKNNISSRDTETILYYFNSLNPKKQKKMLENLDNILKGTVSKSDKISARIAKRLKKLTLSANKYEKIAEKKVLNKLIQQGTPKETAKLQAKSIARQKRSNYQESKLGCKAKKLTPQHKKGGKIFTNFSIVFGMGSTAFGYTQANSGKVKDAKFFSNLAYELSMAYIMSKIGAKIMTRPEGTLLNRYTQSNVQSSGVGIIDATVYAKIYGISQKEAEEKIERLKNSPKQMQALKKLDHYIESSNIVGKFEKHIIDNLAKAIKRPETNEFYAKEQFMIGDQGFQGPLTNELLNNPAYRKKLLQAITREMYQVDRGDLNTGNTGLDKWGYDRLYNATLGIPRAMLVGYTAYNILCTGAHRPASALSKVFALQFINQFMGSYAYYQGRKKFVGQ